MRVVGNASPAESPLMDVIRGWDAAEDPGGRTVPMILPGFTDSRTWRATFPDYVAYGFCPQREMTQYEVGPLWHGADERIHAADVAWASSFFEAMARELCG